MPGGLLGSIPLTALVILAQVINPSHFLRSRDIKVGVFILRISRWAPSSMCSAVYNCW